MSARELIKSIGDILKNQMSLRDDQIMLSYSQFEIPKVDDLYVALSYVSGKAIANTSRFDPDTNTEIISVTAHELIQIDIMSFDSSARERKEEVVAAITSIYSEQIQEQNNFNIGRIPGDFVNAASLEETKILNRFTMTIATTSLKVIERFPEYFDTFGVPPEVTVNA